MPTSRRRKRQATSSLTKKVIASSARTACRDDISLAALAQTDALFYMLESSDVITDPDNQYDLLGVPMSECINAGAIIVGDTLEALCEKVRAGITRP